MSIPATPTPTPATDSPPPLQAKAMRAQFRNLLAARPRRSPPPDLDVELALAGVPLPTADLLLDVLHLEVQALHDEAEGSSHQLAFLVLDMLTKRHVGVGEAHVPQPAETGPDSPRSAPASSARAVEALLACGTLSGGRLAARVATASRLGTIPTAYMEHFQHLMRNLMALASWSPVCTLAGQVVGHGFADDELIDGAVRARQVPAAVVLADARNDLATRRRVVSACLAANQLKWAVSLAQDWELLAYFPTLLDDYRTYVVSRLLHRGLWMQAAGVASSPRWDNAGASRRAQREVVGRAVAVGELAIAHELAMELEIDLQEEFGVTAAAQIGSAVGGSTPPGGWLTLDLPPSDVLFVDDAPSLDILVDRITRATTAIPLLGLDVEWRPEIFGRRRAGRGRSNRRLHGRVLDDTEEVDDPYDYTISGEVESATTFSTKMMMATDVMDVVSIIQLATREWAAVLDLQRVVSLPAFAHVRRLLQDDNIVKLGFDAGGDLKRLRRAYPDEVAFVDCGPWVDIQILTAAAAARRGNNRGDATPPSPTPIPIPIPIPTGAMSRTNR